MNRRLRVCALLTAGAALLVTAAHAWVPPTRAQNITFAARSPGALRAMLRAYIDSADAQSEGAQAALDAGEARNLLGMSYRRAGRPDSALVPYARAYATRSMREDAIPLADLLFERGAHGDADSALRVLAPLRLEAQDSRVGSARALMTRLAWATAQTGHTHDALAMAEDQRDYLAAHADWAMKFATLAMEAGEDSTVLRLLWPGLVRSRGLDLPAMALARRAANRHLRPGDVERRIAQAAGHADSLDRATFGVTYGTLKASDGATLRLWTLGARVAHAPLAMLVPGPAEASVSAYDSLAAQLRRAGYAVALLDARGMRGSVSAEAPGPEIWVDDRNANALLARTATDIAGAIARATLTTHADPRRVVLVTEGPLAMAGALAVQAAPKPKPALVLLTPSPAPCDRGWLAATITASGARVFVQTAPEDVFTNEATDRLIALLPTTRVRAAESRANGQGGAIFRQDGSLTPRLTKWLADVWAAAPVKGGR